MRTVVMLAMTLYKLRAHVRASYRIFFLRGVNFFFLIFIFINFNYFF